MLAGMLAGEASLDADVVDAHTVSYIAIGLLIAVFSMNSQELVGKAAEGMEKAGPAGSARPFLQGSHIGTLVLVVVSLTLISIAWGTNEFIYFNF